MQPDVAQADDVHALVAADRNASSLGIRVLATAPAIFDLMPFWDLRGKCTVLGAVPTA